MQRLHSRFVLIATAFITALALQSCTYHNLEDLQDQGPCFQEEVLPILTANCAQSGCHSALDRQDGYDFSTYDGVLRGIKKGNSAGSKIIEAMRDNEEDVMPPAPLSRLTDDQIAIVAAWIDNGAYNSTGCEAESCDSLAGMSYQRDVKPILDLHCKGCHNINSAGGGYEFENWEQTSGAASTGALLGVLTGDPAYIPMPWNAAPLSPCKIEKLKVWVDEGALDN